MEKKLKLENMSIQELLNAKKVISRALHQNRMLLQQLHKNQNLFDLSTDEVIQFAEKITYTTHAPKLWKPGFPLYSSHPPQPLYEEMRCGALEAYNLKCKTNPQSSIDLTTTTRKRNRDDE